jgi:EamA-like transporter family.
LSLGDAIGLLAAIGIALAGVAVILVSRESGPHRHTPARAVVLAVSSGLAIGVYLSILGTAPVDSGMWVATIGRCVSSSLILGVLAAVLLRARQVPSALRVRYPWNLALAAGGLDALENAIFQLAAQRGSLAIVAVIGSLYPAATVVLARYLLHERLSRWQLGGVGQALVAAAILALG